jgi:glycosyltransferase involved in cell wall biosynthesis
MLTDVLASPSIYTRCCLALASRAAAVYALTEDEKVALAGWIDGRRLSVLPNAVPAGKAPAAHGKYDVVVVSRLHRRKGIALACDVVRALLSRTPSSQVAIAGADEGELAHVAALVADFPDSVHYLGGVSPDAARECIADAKVLLAVATEEPYGLTVVEAFREGTAVVMGTGGYALEEAWASAGAVLTAPRQGFALAEEVEGLLRDPGRRGQVADAGLRWAGEHAGVESMAGKIRDALSADRTRSKAG